MALGILSEASAAIPVSVSGLTPTTYSIWVLIAGCFYLIIRSRPAMKRLQMEQDGSLRTDLLKRVGDLEAELAVERRTCERRLARMQRKLDGAIRQMISFQMMTAQSLPPGTVGPATIKMMKRMTDDLLSSLTIDLEHDDADQDQIEEDERRDAAAVNSSGG